MAQKGRHTLAKPFFRRGLDAEIRLGGVPRIAIIGLGLMGSYYLKLLRERLNVKVEAVCDVDPKKLESVNVPRKYRDFVEMLNEGGFDGVIIATPPLYHKDPAIEALRRGYYVMLEKPMAPNLRDALEIYRAAKGRNKLMLSFSLRYHHLYQRVKQRVDELGGVVHQWHIGMGALPSTPWIGKRSVSGGMLAEHGVHVIYYQVWYAGNVEEVYAHTAQVTRGIEIEDSATLIMKHRGGAVSVYMQSWVGGHSWRKWGVQAKLGRVTVEGYLGGEYSISRVGGDVVESGRFEEPPEHMYVEQLRHFVECIENGWRPITNEEDGIAVQQIVEAAYRSVSTAKPIKLPLPEVL